MHGHFVKFDIYVLKFYSNTLKVVSNLQVVGLPFKPQLKVTYQYIIIAFERV